MTRVAVVAFPVLPEAGRAWLEGVRRLHDPQAPRLGAHFTLVFPSLMDPRLVVDQVRAVSKAQPVIGFTLGEAVVVQDPIAGGHHVFLLPENGRTEFLALHGALYAGALHSNLREDVPFAPHITVASAPSAERCQVIAREVAAALPLQGQIDELQVLEVDSAIRALARVPLVKS